MRSICKSTVVAAVLALLAAPSDSNASSFEACIDRPSRQCLLVIANQAATQTGSPESRARLFLAIAEAHATTGDSARADRAIEAAVAAAGAIRDPARRLSILASVAERLQASGSDAASRRALAEAVRLVGDGLNGQPGHILMARLAVLRGLAALQARLGQSDAFTETADRSIRAADRIQESGLRSAALSMIAEAQSKLDPRAAAQTLGRAVDAATEIPSPAERVAALSAASVTALQTGALRLAVQTVRAALTAAAEVANPSERARLTGGIMLTMLTFGDFPAGAPDDGSRDDCLADPTRACLARHARTAAEALRQGRDGAVYFLHIARSWSAAGDRAAASRALTDTLAALEFVSMPSLRMALLQDVARLQSDIGDRPAALATLTRLARLVDTAVAGDSGLDVRSKVHSLLRVARSSAELGGDADATWFSRAIDLAETAENAWHRATLLRDIAVQYATIDRSAAAETFDLAVDAAAAVEFAESRADLLLTVAESGIEAGLPATAEAVVPDMRVAIGRFDRLTDTAPYRARLALVLLKTGQG